jgi:hypothetical protein
MQSKSYNSTKNAINGLINFLSVTPLIGFKVYEEGNIPDEPVVIGVNHKLKVLVNLFLKDPNTRTRWIDHLFVGAKYPHKVHFMVQDVQYMKSHTKKYLNSLEAFPAHDIRKGLDYLNKGESVGVFPEGQAHLMEPEMIYKGIAWLSARSKRRILPVYVSKNSEKVNNIFHPALNSIYIDYLTPIDPPKSTSREDLEKKIEEFKEVFIWHKRFLRTQKRY